MDVADASVSVSRTGSTRRSRRELDLLLVGPYPPPMGGVAAHVSRAATLLSERGVRIGVLNQFGHRDDDGRVVGTLHRNPLLYWLALRSSSAGLIHYPHARLSTP